MAMAEDTIPERVTTRTITKRAKSDAINIGDADLSIVGLTKGDPVKVVTYNDHIEILPEEDQ